MSAADNGKTVSVTVGDEIVVRLPERPTTGYRWVLEPVDGSLLDRHESSFVLDADPRPGQGGIREFRFRSTAAGTTPISLKHWREWSGEGSVIERFSVQVRST